MSVIARVVALLTLVVLIGSARSLSAAPLQRLAVVVGANLGSPEDDPLRFAESDARRVRELLVELGEVRRDRALLILGGSPAQVLSALTEVRGRAAELAEARARQQPVRRASAQRGKRAVPRLHRGGWHHACRLPGL